MDIIHPLYPCISLPFLGFFPLCYLQVGRGYGFLAYAYNSLNQSDIEDFLHDGDSRFYRFAFSRKADDVEVLHLTDKAKADARLHYIFIIIAEPCGTSLCDVFYEACRCKPAVVAEHVVGPYGQRAAALRLVVVRQAVHHDEWRPLRQKFQ